MSEEVNVKTGTSSSFFLALLLLFLGLTNNWLTVSEPHHRRFIEAGAGDGLNYLAIAESAPFFPKNSMPYHHAQRWVIPYVLGLVHCLIPVSTESIFRVATIFVVIFMTMLAYQTLIGLGVERIWVLSILFILVLNPYVFRYYLAIPLMIDAVFFIFGLNLCCYFLVQKRPVPFLASICLCALSRQTTLMLIPGFSFGALFCFENSLRPWNFKRRVGLALATILIPIGIYCLNSQIAVRFATPSQNLKHVLGLFFWLFRDFSLRTGIEFFFRGLIPYWIILCFFSVTLLRKKKIAIKKLNRIEWTFVLLWVGAILQPILGGPAITGKSIARLGVMGLFPWVYFLGSHMARSPIGWPFVSRRKFVILFALLGILGVASFHHLYSFRSDLNTDHAFRFALIYFTSGLFIALAMKWVFSQIEETLL